MLTATHCIQTAKSLLANKNDTSEDAELLIDRMNYYYLSPVFLWLDGPGIKRQLEAKYHINNGFSYHYLIVSLITTLMCDEMIIGIVFTETLLRMVQLSILRIITDFILIYITFTFIMLLIFIITCGINAWGLKIMIDEIVVGFESLGRCADHCSTDISKIGDIFSTKNGYCSKHLKIDI